MEKIQFFEEDIEFTLKEKTNLRKWLKATIHNHNKRLTSLNYIFTSDNYLLKLNQSFLDHDTYTDIITFNQSSDPNYIEADIYISIDRISENSKEHSSLFSDELHRVMIHGLLHLLGFNDKTKSEEEDMRKKENHYLALRFK